MALFCYACHRIYDSEKENCTYDSFELIEADCTLPQNKEVDGIKLEFQSCVFPGEYIRAYRARCADEYDHLIYATINSDIVDNENFNAWFEKRKEIKHHNVTDCITYGELPDEGKHFVISEYPYGESILEELQSDGEMKAKICVYVADQMLDALIGLRDQGVFHGNLMPSKCLLVDDPSKPNLLKIAGLSLPENCFTNLQDIPGEKYPEFISPLYISPERVEGAPACEASEIYSVGAIMYECLSGIPAYTARSKQELIKKLTEGQILPLRGVAPELAIPPMLDEFVLKAMSKDPKDRFPTFEKMQRELLKAARKSRIYLPEDAGSKFTPQSITEEFSIPKIVLEEVAREAQQKEEEATESEEAKEIKAQLEEAKEIDEALTDKVNDLRKTTMLLAIVAIVAIIGVASVLMSEGSDHDKGPLWVKLKWEQEMSQADSSLKSQNFDDAINQYQKALTTTGDIKDNDTRAIKTLSGLLKAYKEQGNKDMANQIRKRLKNMKRAHMKALEAN